MKPVTFADVGKKVRVKFLEDEPGHNESYGGKRGVLVSRSEYGRVCWVEFPGGSQSFFVDCELEVIP